MPARQSRIAQDNLNDDDAYQDWSSEDETAALKPEVLDKVILLLLEGQCH